MSGRARLRIKPAGAWFVDSVLADLLKIRRMKDGPALLRRLRDLSVVVTISRPESPSMPPNAWTQAAGPNSRHEREILIMYDPANWPQPADPANMGSAEILFGRLADAAEIASEM